jgi:hypothetical protein
MRETERGRHLAHIEERVMTKRFDISKLYEGPPVLMPSGTVATGLHETVEQYDDEFTARVRVAILNHGLAEKKYTLHECIDPENDNWIEVDTDDED